MRYVSKRKETALTINSPHFGNFIKGDVYFDISNPETEGAIGCYFDRTDAVVPEPSHDKQVGYGNPEYKPVSADCLAEVYQAYYENDFECKQSTFECYWVEVLNCSE